MKPAAYAAFVILALSAFSGACSKSDPATRTSPASTRTATTNTRTASTSLPKLAFFMNPNGTPCEIQDGILRNMASELQSEVTLVRYETTQSKDLSKFQQYGIRALPTLVLLDPTGKELRRAPPGIQSPEQVRKLIGE